MSEFWNNLFHSVLPNNKDFLVYKSGKSNVILSAPHGGRIKPISIPRRKYGNRSGDSYTKDLLLRVVELLPNKPYYIYCNLHRSRIDLNRDMDEATQGNKEMQKLWDIWKYTLDNYLNEVRFFYGKGLYIDIHSHNNHDKFMIGYGISIRDYLILMDDKQIPTKNSTMHSLKEFSEEKYISEHSVLFGAYSFPKTLESRGYKVLIPKNDKAFLNGGRNIMRNHGKGIGALQIECPISILKKDLESVAQALVESINVFSIKFLQKD